MNTYNYIQKPVNGRLIIDVPKEYFNITLKVMIEPMEDKKQEIKKKENKRLKKILKYKGILSKPGYEPPKEEWYEQ